MLRARLAHWLLAGGALAGIADAAITVTPVGAPSWQPVDLHLVSVPIGPAPDFPGVFPTLAAILPPPEHEPHPQLGIGPGAPHAPPYDHEIGDGLSANSWTDAAVFTLPQFSKGNAVMLTFMVVPLGGGLGTLGATPDYPSGLMIPNSICPIELTIESLAGGQPFSAPVTYAVPALDGNLDPPFPGIDGHSHFPNFFFDAAEFANPGVDVFGAHEYRLQARDQLGNGWDIVATFEVTADPGGACVYGWSRRFGLPGMSGGLPSANAFQTWDDGNGPALYIGGAFTDAGGNLGGPNTLQNIARWDGEAFSPLTNGPTNGTVSAFALFDDDGAGPRPQALYVAGGFTQIGGFSATRIARWDGLGWESLATGLVGSTVAALEVFDEDGPGPNPPRLFAGGFITTAGGNPVNNLARWDGAAWTAVGGPINGVNGSVLAMKVYSESLVVGGTFGTAAGQVARGLAGWDGSNWTPISTGASATVRALETFDDGGGDALFVGGTFTQINGVNANNVARYQSGVFSALGSGVTGSSGVDALRAYDDGLQSALYVGGPYTSAGGQPANGIAFWDGVGWTPLPAAGAARMLSLGVFDDGKHRELYASGPWQYVDDIRPYGIARWNGGRWAALGRGASSENKPLNAAAVHDDGSGPRLYVGGSAATIEIGGERTGSVAAWNGDEWESLFPGATTGTQVAGGGVEALESIDWDGAGPGTAELYAGGGFTQINGLAINRVARFDAALGAWTAVGTGFVGTVYDLMLFDDDGAGPIPPALYAAGQNLLTCGAGCTYAVARWDGSTWTGIGSTGGGDMRRLVAFDADGGGPAGETLIAVGSNTGGPMVRCVAGAAIPGCLNGGPATGFDARDAVVYDSGSGPQLYICGWFREPGLDTLIRRWNGASWDIIPFNPGFPLTRVNAMTVFDDGSGPKLYSASGVFNGIGGAATIAVRSWDGATDAPVGGGLVAPFSNFVDEMLVHDDDGPGAKPASLWLIGETRYVEGVSAYSVLEWAALPPQITLQPESQRVPQGLFVQLTTDAAHSGARLFRWTKDGVPLADAPSRFGAATATLLIFAATEADEGDYRCVVSDACGQTCTVAAQLDVYLGGDMNCDGVVDFFDIDPFLLALFDPAGYQAALPHCDLRYADLDGNESVDFFDINPFLDALFG